ncbi:hypothetical protein, partial [Pseudomonas sp.]|uniref:hypothetical protein n=1 Tax=Pseudomonas sp. TaxID=306 RepID=UPI00258F7C75
MSGQTSCINSNESYYLLILLLTARLGLGDLDFGRGDVLHGGHGGRALKQYARADDAVDVRRIEKP